MGSGNTYGRRNQAKEGLVVVTAAVVANSTNTVSIYSDPMSYAVTRSIVNCAQILARWFRGTISAKEALGEFCVEGGGLIGGLAGAGIGALIGGLIFPGVGHAIGGVIGLVAGYKAGRLVVSKSTVVAIRKEDSQELKQDLYEGALQEFGLYDTSSNDAVEAKKKRFFLIYHPDKNRGNEEYAREQFCKYSALYSIIVGYRQAHGWW